MPVRLAELTMMSRGLQCKRIQVDEIWSLYYVKQKNVEKAKKQVEGGDDIWTSICADYKLICNWVCGGRDTEYAKALMDDLKDRLKIPVFSLPVMVIRLILMRFKGSSGIDIDYAILVKFYGNLPEDKKQK